MKAGTANNDQLLYERIRDLVVDARSTVARGVDLVQVRTDFEIGRHIVEHEQQGALRAAYGKEVLTRLDVPFYTRKGYQIGRAHV